MNLDQPFLDRVKKAGLLRSSYAPMQQFVMAEFIIPSFLAALPLYRLLVPEEDVSSPAIMAQAKEFRPRADGHREGKVGQYAKLRHFKEPKPRCRGLC